MKDTLRLTDISTAEGQMVSIDLKDIQIGRAHV